MITVADLELRAGARVLIEHASFQVAKGDRIGLVGRNGAGKTTLLKVVAGEGLPASGSVRKGDVGYLPQDPRTGDLVPGDALDATVPTSSPRCSLARRGGSTPTRPPVLPADLDYAITS